MTSNYPTPIQVVCAILYDSTGKVLAAQRPHHKQLPLHWEFPGGKIESGETPEQAITREIQEELNVNLVDLEPLPAVNHDYNFARIQLIPFRSTIHSKADIHLSEHVGSAWIELKDWQSLNWAPADIPIITNLISQ